ncbi:helix-turn-helix domain-containing protein [bacterium]|nr:helix-turn-helix domain-containing protein [bacterium]
MPNKEKISLAQFVVEKREKLNLTQSQLADNSGLGVDVIRSIEEGYETFLPTTIRQKLAKGLKVENKEIKRLERHMDYNLAQKSKMDEIRELILLNSSNPDFEIKCPVCGEKLITRIAKLYDLEDNLILRPKARCSKCPFQLVD